MPMTHFQDKDGGNVTAVIAEKADGGKARKLTIKTWYSA